MYVHVPHVGLMPGVGGVGQRGSQISWHRRDSWEAAHRCWDPNGGPLGGVCALNRQESLRAAS